MTKQIDQELAEFLNALQLSIKTKLVGIRKDGKGIVIAIEKVSADDAKLFNFLKLFEKGWNDSRTEITIQKIHDLSWSKITLFLLLTRMDEENISKLAELDPTAAEISRRLGMEPVKQGIESLSDITRVLLKKLEEKKMTMRVLAEKTNLTQVSISRFKSGKDFKVSNLLNIAKALGAKLIIK